MKNIAYHSIQIEDTLHIIPDDETDLHALVEPCDCKPTTPDENEVPPDPHWNGIKRIVFHQATSVQNRNA